MWIFNPHKRRFIRKSTGAQLALDRLENYLKGNFDEPVRFLCGFWDDQQSVVSYRDLREAIEMGAFTEEAYRLWTQDYSVLVREKMNPMWVNAMKAGAYYQPLLENQPFEFNTQTTGVLRWISERGADFVTMCADEQKEAIKCLLLNKIVEQHTVDELAHVIRPCIGLTAGQAAANLKYYDNIVKTLSEEHPRMKMASIRAKALDASLKYAETQHRQRAMTIAQTEMAFAYNRGADEGIRQAQSQRLIGHVKKVWSTSEDDRVCPTCAALEGTELEMDEVFSFRANLFSDQNLVPPAHPMCACAVQYVEEDDPNWSLSEESEDLSESLIDQALYDSESSPLHQNQNGDIIQTRNTLLPINLQMFARIPEEKFTKYALNPIKQPDKAEAFKNALGYTAENSSDLIQEIDNAFDESKLTSRGKNEYGDKFEQIIEITGPNGKTARVMTGWIRYFGETEYNMTSVYVTEKKR